MALKYRKSLIPTKEEQQRISKRIQWMLYGLGLIMTILMLQEEIQILTNNQMINDFFKKLTTFIKYNNGYT